MARTVTKTSAFHIRRKALRSHLRPEPRGLRMALSLAAALALGGTALGASPPASQSVPLPTATNFANESSQFWFGVAVENIPPAFARQLKLKPEQGVLVTTVFAGSPAEKAGIRPDDLLVELNGKPLTSQDDLAKAANTPNPARNGVFKTPPPPMQESDLVYLRDGGRVTARLTPAPRPADMLVNGANRQALNPNDAVGQQQANPARNMVLSNGNTVQVGPAYRFDSQSQSNLKILRDAVGNGQALMLNQDTDRNGNVTNSINDGRNTYIVEPGNIDQLPQNYRPLAQQMLNPAQNAAPNGAGQGFNSANGPRDNSGSTDERLKRLEQQNEELKAQLEQLKTLLLRYTPVPANAGTTTPNGR